MLDLYSKIVLSVIAVALIVIAWNGLGDGRAVAAFGEGCGASSFDACYVRITDRSDKITVEIDAGFNAIPVDVQNWPIR
jgi:hypothetical protein